MSLIVKNLCFSYGKNRILKDITFAVEEGEFVSILGANGVGKSTLFRCILGLFRPDSGEIQVNGRNALEMKPSELSKIMAYIPQSHNPVFNYSVFDVVLMGTTAQLKSSFSPGKNQFELVKSALKQLGIFHLKDRGYRNISGGERQLVLIARAIVQQAKIFIMDEPAANLDYGNRIKVMRTMKKLTEEGYIVIQSTHEPEQAFFYSDKVLAMHEGKVLGYGTPDEIICGSVVSELYGVDVEVCSLKDDKVRVCVPINE